MADDGAPRAAKRARSAPAAGEGSSMVARQAAENAKLGRTGGIYVPPFKLAALRQEMADKDKRSAEFQRLSWEALRKGINGLVNKVNVGNIRSIVPELLELNLVRGRGLLCRALMKAQLASPGFTHIYAALVAVLNTKLPENGELLLKRVLVGFRRAYRRRDKVVATGFAKFLAHLCNHQVAHELVALQLLTVLLDDPTDDSVEIAVQFTKEVGQLLDEVSPRGLLAVFERFRGILHEGADPRPTPPSRPPPVFASRVATRSRFAQASSTSASNTRSRASSPRARPGSPTTRRCPTTWTWWSGTTRSPSNSPWTTRSTARRHWTFSRSTTTSRRTRPRGSRSSARSSARTTTTTARMTPTTTTTTTCRPRPRRPRSARSRTSRSRTS